VLVVVRSLYAALDCAVPSFRLEPDALAGRSDPVDRLLSVDADREPREKPWLYSLVSL